MTIPVLGSLEQSNLVLIGMPGSGKSTLGRRLAKDLERSFVDTDQLIEQYESKPVQNIIDEKGLDYFRKVEQTVLCQLDVRHHVIATGGSAVLSDVAMRYLSSIGTVLYLKIELSTMLQRINDVQTRGLVKQASETLEDLYRSRYQNYQRWADLTLENDLPMDDLRYSELKKQITDT